MASAERPRTETSYSNCPAGTCLTRQTKCTAWPGAKSRTQKASEVIPSRKRAVMESLNQSTPG